MMTKHSPSPKPIRRNRHRRVAPVEPLSARLFRLRIARGYSIYDLSREAGIFAGTIQQLESGKPADKQVLPTLAASLGVPLCHLVCGDHNCAAASLHPNDVVIGGAIAPVMPAFDCRPSQAGRMRSRPLRTLAGARRLFG